MTNEKMRNLLINIREYCENTFNCDDCILCKGDCDFDSKPHTWTNKKIEELLKESEE